MTTRSYDALLIVSFGGPEGRDQVIPFLERVLRGRNVPRERMLEVAEHYYHFDGISPINGQNRELIASLAAEFDRADVDLPIYWGNRNWHPLLTETIQQMAADGIRRSLAFVTSAYSSYSGCRQYREDIALACEQVGAAAPQIDKLRVFYNHPGFVNPSVERVVAALKKVPASSREATPIVFTAHSIPESMSRSCDYLPQLQETARLIGERCGPNPWQLVYQSRSGPPSQPWLEPDICDCLRDLHGQGVRDVVVAPIGFISDHMEVLYDLDTEARELCDKIGLNMIRAGTVGTHPTFITMIRQLVEERLTDQPTRLALGQYGPNHDVCPEDCCPAPRRPPQQRSPVAD